MAIGNILLHDIADNENVWVEAHSMLNQLLQLREHYEFFNGKISDDGREPFYTC